MLSQARWTRNGTRYPVWVDEPKDVWSRGYVPVRLLNPEGQSEVRPWADAAASNDLATSRDIESKLTSLRGQVASYNVPYLSLPVTTAKDVALEVHQDEHLLGPAVRLRHRRRPDGGGHRALATRAC